MHVHTRGHSSDSTLDPTELPRLVEAGGITGVNVSEHHRVWDRHTRLAYLEEHPGLFINFGMEVSTDLGHMLAIGLDSYEGGIHRAERLRAVLDRVGGFLIVAHPFRHAFETRAGGVQPLALTAEQAAELPVFRLVDAIEAANGCNTPRENYFAAEVARIAGPAHDGRQRRALRERHRLLRDGPRAPDRGSRGAARGAARGPLPRRPPHRRRPRGALRGRQPGRGRPARRGAGRGARRGAGRAARRGRAPLAGAARGVPSARALAVGMLANGGRPPGREEERARRGILVPRRGRDLPRGGARLPRRAPDPRGPGRVAPLHGLLPRLQQAHHPRGRRARLADDDLARRGRRQGRLHLAPPRLR